MAFEKRREREKENRKSAILKAARKLFFEKGFKSVTVDSIAKKAELSKGAVYLYFKSKDEIYSQILLNDIDKFHERVSGLSEGGGKASDMLFQLSSIYVDFFLKDRELFRILMKIFRYGADSGEYLPSLNVRQIRNGLWGMLNGIVSLYIFIGSESRREELIRSTINTSLEIFIRGLRSG